MAHRWGTALVAGVVGVAVGLAAPAAAGEVAHHLKGSTIAKGSIPGNRLKSHAIKSAQVAPLVFHPLELAAGWHTVYTTRPPSYAIDLQGVVHLSGGIQASSGAGTVAFVLPEVARPLDSIYLPTQASNTDLGDIIIDPDGDVTPRSESAGSSSGYTGLDGISYSPEPK